MDPEMVNAMRDSVHSSEIGSSRMDEEESNEDLAYKQGFIHGFHLDTYARSKAERMKTGKLEEDKQAMRDKYKKKRDNKALGKSNKMKLKNKPMAMLIPKKAKELKFLKYQSNMKRKQHVRQLGKFTKATK